MRECAICGEPAEGYWCTRCEQIELSQPEVQQLAHGGVTSFTLQKAMQIDAPYEVVKAGPWYSTTVAFNFEGRRREFSRLVAVMTGTRRCWRRATRPAGPPVHTMY